MSETLKFKTKVLCVVVGGGGGFSLLFPPNKTYKGSTIPTSCFEVGFQLRAVCLLMNNSSTHG